MSLLLYLFKSGDAHQPRARWRLGVDYTLRAKVCFAGFCPIILESRIFLVLERTAADVDGVRGGELIANKPNKIVDVVKNPARIFWTDHTQVLDVKRRLIVTTSQLDWTLGLTRGIILF